MFAPSLRVTPLSHFHESLHAKFVDFAGWWMPIAYENQSISATHKHTREKACMFDVGHMGVYEICGQGSISFLNSLVPSDVRAWRSGRSRLTVLTNDRGGIIDDLLVTKLKNEKLNLVVNASNAKKDWDYLQDKLNAFPHPHIRLSNRTEIGTLAFQGPRAESVIASILEKFQVSPDIDLTSMQFMEGKREKREIESSFYLARELRLRYFPDAVNHILLSRSGYTGEDGFEIQFHRDVTEEVAYYALHAPDLKVAGLGTRDTLRIEAGLNLYGHEMDEDISPVEAGLSWLVSKKKLRTEDFPGRDRIAREIFEPHSLKSSNRGLSARQGDKILDGEEILGHVTSGVASPSLGVPIAMGFISNKWLLHHHQKKQVSVAIRGKERPFSLVQLPFICSRKL